MQTADAVWIVCEAADAGQHADVLPAAISPTADVADNAGRQRWRPPQLGAGFRVQGFQARVQRAEKDQAAGGGERAAPNRQRFAMNPPGAAECGVPGAVPDARPLDLRLRAG